MRLTRDAECSTSSSDPKFNNYWPRRIFWSRAIIGYNIVYSKECNSYDVLKCIKHSLSKWERLKLKIPISYHESAGFPSSISDDYIGAKWKNFSCDGALANLANTLKRIPPTTRTRTHAHTYLYLT